MPRKAPWVVAYVCLLAGLGAGLAPPAVAVHRAGERCSRDQLSAERIDPVTGTVVRCAAGDGGWQWRAADGAPAAPTTTVAAWPSTNSPFAEGKRCSVGSVALAPDSGARLTCPKGTWEVDPPGSSVLPPMEVPAVPEVPALPRVVAVVDDDSLDPDLGNPTGLPPGVTLPPGTTVLTGSPRALPSDDWWKYHRWLTEATVATTNLEAIHAWFVGQCANLGWVYEATKVERLPSSPPPGRFYDQAWTMVIGECRTAAGSAVDPSRKRPWYLSWGVSLRQGAAVADLVVELRATSHLGGRPG